MLRRCLLAALLLSSTLRATEPAAPAVAVKPVDQTALHVGAGLMAAGAALGAGTAAAYQVLTAGFVLHPLDDKGDPIVDKTESKGPTIPQLTAFGTVAASAVSVVLLLTGFALAVSQLQLAQPASPEE